MIQNRKELNIDCGQCDYRNLCFPRTLPELKIKSLNQIIDKISILEKGEYVYRKGEKMQAFFAVYEGYCQEYWSDIKGNEYIENFYFPGDILGLEHSPLPRYIYSASALTPAKLCIIPKIALFELAQDSPEVFFRLFHISSYKILNNSHIKRTTNAKSRVANFLMNVILRYQERQMDTQRVWLPMSRLSISNFLGMAFETVSRIFHDFEREGLVEIHSKEIFIINFDKLRKIASPIENFGQV